MSIEKDISRIVELLEVLTEFVVIGDTEPANEPEPLWNPIIFKNQNILDRLAQSERADLVDDNIQLRRNITTIKEWLSIQASIAWEKRRNAEANTFETTLDFITNLKQEGY